jgi:hypothetical protein
VPAHELYAAGREPVIVEMPELGYLMIDGHGDPNTATAYGEAVEALYTIAYAAKFAIKRAPDGVDYGVLPLEGLWWTPDMSTFTTEDKSAWCWTTMIMQPDVVTPEVFEEALEKAAEKKSPETIGRLRLERFAEGPAAQTMHIGPYAAEGPTIERLHAFIAQQGYERAGKHHEIYLSDPRRAAPEKMKTVASRSQPQAESERARPNRSRPLRRCRAPRRGPRTHRGSAVGARPWRVGPPASAPPGDAARSMLTDVPGELRYEREDTRPHGRIDLEAGTVAVDRLQGPGKRSVRSRSVRAARWHSELERTRLCRRRRC